MVSSKSVPAKKLEALAAIDKAMKVVGELCTGEQRWRMSIPAEPESDPDLIIADALGKAHDLVAEAWEEGKPQTRAEQKASDALMSDDEYELRKFIAFAHQDGKCHIYGDDGELQCSDMIRHGRTIDFRREPIPALLEVIYTTRLREYIESQKTPPAPAGTEGLREALGKMMDDWRHLSRMGATHPAAAEAYRICVRRAEIDLAAMRPSPSAPSEGVPKKWKCTVCGEMIDEKEVEFVRNDRLLEKPLVMHRDQHGIDHMPVVKGGSSWASDPDDDFKGMYGTSKPASEESTNAKSPEPPQGDTP